MTTDSFVIVVVLVSPETEVTAAAAGSRHCTALTFHFRSATVKAILAHSLFRREGGVDTKIAPSI